MMSYTGEEQKPEETASSSEAGGTTSLSQEELDALFAGAFSSPAAPVEEAPPAMDAELPSAPRMEEHLSQAEDSVLLTEANVEDILSGLDVDDVIVGDPVAEPSPTPVESLLEEALSAPPAAQEASPPPVRTISAEHELTDDLLAALLSAAETPESPQQVVTENLAAAATAPAGPAPTESPSAKRNEPVEQTLDEASPAEAPAPEAVATKPAPTIQRQKLFRDWLRHYGPRAAASIAAAFIGATATFVLLYTNQEKRPTFADLGVQQLIDLQEAYDRAKELAGSGHFHEARRILEKPLALAPASELKTNADYLMLECRFHTLDADIGSPFFPELHADIDQLTGANPDHPRTPEALYWKARLYLRQELPALAYTTMQSIIEDHPDAPALDGILIETAELAIDASRPLDAASYLQQLLSAFPGSHYAGEARLLLADTYRIAGMLDDARTLYARAAEGDPDPQIRANAVLRLGNLSLDGGDYPSAESLFERYLAQTVSFEGSDAVYLELARTQRALGKLTQARDTLTDMINFFPVTERTPVAYVELTEVSDALGLREEAVKLSQQAAIKFPANPGVLKSKGIMLGLSGKPIAAAEALLAAEDAGAFDPEMLLTAARHLRTASLTDQALRVYQRLKDDYSGLPAAIEGAIDAAKLHYDLGDIRKAVEEMQALELATSATPQHLSVLLAQADLFDKLGWTDELAIASRKIAGLASSDEDLAQSALGLLAADETNEAKTIYDRIDLATLREPTAYALQWKLGEQLLAQSPRDGIEMMERAWQAYPSQRTRDDEKNLLRAFLAANRPAAARRLIMELAMQAEQRPIDSIHLLEAAITWGDYLYGRGDYRTAAEAYAMAEEAAARMNVKPSTPGLDPRWAQYQRANALLQLRDYQGGLRLMDEIATSGAPWAKEAAAKASHTRFEQRLSAARPTAG